MKKTSWDEDGRAAVHLATAKMLTSESVPDEPTIAWLYTVDRNADRDLDGGEHREEAGRVVTAVGEIMSDRAVLPSKRRFTETDRDAVDEAEEQEQPQDDVPARRAERRAASSVPHQAS